VELGLFLFPVQGDVRGVDVQYQLARTTPLAGNELLDQHPVQGHDIGSRRPLLQAAQGRAAAQFIARADRGLHQRVVTQGRMVVQVFVAAAQGIQSLRHQVAQLVRNAILVARVVQCRGHGPG
jgi:hypothetical protein